MSRIYKAKINYTMKPTHPDKDYVIGGWKPDKVYSFEDEYRFSDYCTNNEAMEIIKDDLRLVAGGGYNWNHIDNIEFEIKEVM